LIINPIQIYPVTLENFISDDECETLLNIATHNEELFEAMSCEIPRWDKRNIHAWMLEDDHKGAHNAILQIADRIQNKIREMENTENIWLEVPMYSRWLQGDSLMPPHADNIEQDGITPNSTQWRSHGIVLYLNDNFLGGELLYKNHDITLKPIPRTCAIHRAGIEDSHGVFEVQKGTRHTIITFACTDKDYVDKEKDNFLDWYKEDFG